MYESVSLGKSAGIELYADFYRSQIDAAPLIVAASGGGWCRGNRHSLAQWGEHFSKHGYSFASVDYRRAGDRPAFPENANDVCKALNYFTTHASRHGVDPNRIGILGVSAGAHLAALCLLSSEFITPKLKCMACIYGPYDLLTHWQSDLRKNTESKSDLTQRMIGSSPFDAPDLYHRASPARLVKSEDRLPVFLGWGDKDFEVSPKQSETFALTLHQAGYPVRRMELAGAGHFWFTEEDLTQVGSFSHRAASELGKFFEKNLAN